MIAVSIHSYIEDEVERQGFERGTSSFSKRVEWMAGAWEYAQHRESELIRLTDVLHVGSLCERELNATGFRRVGVRVGSNIKMHWILVERAVENLLEAQVALEPAVFYYEYETIHPFVDGNGRSGKVLFNWLNHTLSRPVMPPNFWGSANP